uniref:Uncharacterized protein n=3 Tax=Meloidogyne TaxID=189290 RepID=A0A6V7VNT3_MELEN|nr:unnamed protein product [Meloidogyne enterolobii]
MAIAWATGTDYNSVEDYDLVMLDFDNVNIWQRLRTYPVVSNDPSRGGQGMRTLVTIYKCRTANCGAHAKVVKRTKIRNEAFVSAVVFLSVAEHVGHLRRSESEMNAFRQGIQRG